MKKGGIKIVEIVLLLIGSFIIAYSVIPRIKNISSVSKDEDMKVFVKRLNEAGAVFWSKSLRDGNNGSIKYYPIKKNLIFPNEIKSYELHINNCGNGMFNIIFEKNIGKKKYLILCKDGNNLMLPKFKLISVEVKK
ncbi:hypothetical protein [Caminibacter pacificus]|jgi:hypothetical protein